jgi:hypothetical protein
MRARQLLAAESVATRYSVEELRAVLADKVPDAKDGMSVVYHVFLRQQPVAVKLVTLAGLPDSYRALLAGEIDLLASLGRHPNIVQLRGCVCRARMRAYWCSLQDRRDRSMVSMWSVGLGYRRAPSPIL